MEIPSDSVESTVGYTFRDNHIMEEAMEQDRNKRLAFLGDKVVGLMLIDAWYRSERSCGMACSPGMTSANIFPEDGNSQLQYYACNKEMARQAKRTHIDKFIRPDPLHPSGALQSTHGLATDIEAIVGAVWVDSERDFEAVEGVMKRLNIYPNQL